MSDSDGFSYAQLEQILAKMYRATAPDALPKLRARYKKLQAYSIPIGCRPGRGRTTKYSIEHILQICVCFELAECGIDPRDVAVFIRDYYPIDNFVNTYLSQELDLVFVITPYLMSKSWVDQRRSFNITVVGNRKIVEPMLYDLEASRSILIDVGHLATILADAIHQVGESGNGNS